MKLKKIELFGFKTFPEPTELVFHDGITAIVGPNGCGKSNIIDAIRWVMGETSAKGLRGDSMEDVIFSGSDSRRPLHLAEVTLTLTEVEGHLAERFGTYHEVAVTRRLDRSGGSEYLINKAQCRLRDVTELFMDTGVGRRAYSVVEQGKIDFLLSSKPKDRRVLIEEAAGITKFKSRKDETARKMEQTSQNLQRLGDIIGEVRREANALKRQAVRAEAFKTLRAEKRALERDLFVAAWLDLEAKLAAARSALGAQERELVEARVRSKSLAANLEQGRLDLLEEEGALEARKSQVFQLRSEIAQRESRAEFLDRDAEALASRAARAESELREVSERSAALASEIEEVSAALAEVEQRISARGATAEALRGKHRRAVASHADAEQAVERHKRSLLNVLGELTRANHGLDHARQQEAEASRRLAGIARQHAELLSKTRETDREIELRDSELVTAEKVRDSALEERAGAENALREARSKRQRVGRDVEEARKALHTDESRLQGLLEIKESLDGYGAGVKAVLQEARRRGGNGVLGVVADTITAPARYESALEAALGERLQYVIVAHPEQGLAAVRRLKEQRAGRSSFAPVNVREPRSPRLPGGSEPWAHGPLLELVEVAPEYERIARSLLGDVFVVETLEHALNLWEQNGVEATLVTLDGETVSPEGVISGGAGKGDGAGLLRKNREIRELREAVASASARLSALEAGLAGLDEEVARLETRLEVVREEVHRAELRVVHVAKDLGQLRERRERLEERCEAIEFEREELSSAMEGFGAEVATLEQERARLLKTQEEIESTGEELGQALARARDLASSLQAGLNQHEIEEATDRERRDGLGERARTLAASEEHAASREKKLEAEAREAVAQRRERLEELRRVRLELEERRAGLAREETALSALSQEVDRRRTRLGLEEKGAAEARRAEEELQRSFGETGLGVRDLELQAENLRERFRERLGGDLANETGLSEAYDAARTEGRLRELDARLAELGEINLLAIEEYEERRARCEFLETQSADLEKSLANLRQAIAKINRISKTRFSETFERVSATFQEVYPRLFRGGEARLLLTEPDDLLETGIDIIARPPGKRAQHISLLSGGEKALTAAALIFSVFLVKPSPFCILDEVDAPLDEANIGRFSEMVREMSVSSQFLIITHNKATMEAADHLYGVTMAEPGVSKMVSVRLADDRSAAAAA